MWAVRNNHLETADALIKAGAKIELEGARDDATNIAFVNGYDEMLKVLNSQEAFFNNIKEEVDNINGQKSIKTHIMRTEKDSKIASYRLFCKEEEGEVFYSIEMKLLNKKEETTEAVAYGMDTKLTTFTRKLSPTTYKNEKYYTELYTIIFDQKEFMKFVEAGTDIPFGLRRGKSEFEFIIPAGAFGAIYNMANSLGWIK